MKKIFACTCTAIFFKKKQILFRLHQTTCLVLKCIASICTPSASIQNMLRKCTFMQQANHGFGMRQQNIPTDKWIERLGDWLDGQ